MSIRIRRQLKEIRETIEHIKNPWKVFIVKTPVEEKIILKEYSGKNIIVVSAYEWT